MHFGERLLDLLKTGQNQQVKSSVQTLNLYKVTDSQGQTLLHHAAVCGNLEITKYLLENGSDVDAVDEEGENALTRCLEVRQYATAQLLLEAGSDFSYLLHSLVMWSDAQGVKLLIDHGANIEETNDVGATPVFYLYADEDNIADRERENIEILQTLLRLGASLMTCVSRGGFQIFPTLMHGSREAVRLILQLNIDFNAQDKSHAKTILHHLAMNRNPGIVEELQPYIERFDVNALDARNISPLREAVSRGNIKMIKFLLHKAARVDFLCRPRGSTVLWTAFDNTKRGTPEQYEKCIELLLQHKVNPQATMRNNVGKILTLVDIARLTKGFDKLKFVIAQMAIDEKQRIQITEPTLSAIHSHIPSKIHLKSCRRLLKKKVDGTISVFKLLTASNGKIEKYLSKKLLIKKLIRISHKQQSKYNYKYYFNTVEQRFKQVFLSKTLRNKAASVISNLLEYRINETDIVTEKIINFLHEQDLRQLYLM